MTRKFSSTSVETTLATGISTSATSITVATGTGAALMGGQTLAAGNVDQFTIAIDPDTANEEIVFVTAISSDTLTVVRGRAGSSAITHSGGAAVKHVLTSNDLDYFTSAADNGITSASTSTLTNKTISLTSNTVTGTTAQFNTALSDNDFATLAGIETLTNKTLTSPILTNAVSSIALNTRTAAYTLLATDKSKLVIMNSASTANVTVPSAVFSQGDVIYVTRLGTGAVALTASGVTINSPSGLNLRAQYSTAALLCTATNVFLATGDLSV